MSLMIGWKCEFCGKECETKAKTLEHIQKEHSENLNTWIDST